MVTAKHQLHRRLFSVLAGCTVVTLTGACSTSSTPTSIERDSITYSPPSSPTRGITPVSVSAEPEGVRDVVENSLSLAGFEVEERPESDLIVATYRGAPDRYIDCGTYAFRGIEPRSAAARTVSVAAGQGENIRLERRLDLYARTTIELDDTPGSTRLDQRVDYVVVKNVDAFDSSGELISTNPEVISFSSGGSDSFDIGTTCVSKGVLETSIAETVRAAFGVEPTVVASAPRPLSAPAPVSTSGPLTTPDVCVGGSQAAYCELVDFVQARDWRHDVGIAPLGGGRQIREGEQIVLDIEAPADLPVLSVSYVDVYGQVVNLRPIRLSEGLRRSAFVTKAEVAAPFGEEMIVVVAGADPQLGADRPFTETMTSFTNYLSQLYVREGNDIALNYVPVTTVPAGPAS